VARVPENETPAGTPAPGGDKPTNDTPPAPPPAAETVLNGAETEETVKLRAELDAEKSARKKAETLAAEKEDEVHRLKTPATPPAVARPAAKAKPEPKPSRVRVGLFRTEDQD